MKKPLPVHPLLFATFPVLFLFSQNIDQFVSLSTLVRILALVVGGAAALVLLLSLAFRDVRKAGLAVSALVLLFFSYGHVWRYFNGAEFLGFWVGTEAFLIGIWVVLGLAGLVAAAVSGKRIASVTKTLNMVAAVLVVVNVVSIARGLGEGGDVASGPPRSSGETTAARAPSNSPDIYYLIFDRYAGEQTLREDYGFDNGTFLRYLEDKGFFVASGTRANYGRTSLSLASSLGMRYVNFLSKQAGENTGDNRPVYNLLQNSRVPVELKSLGYRYVHIGSHFGPTNEDPAADINLQKGDLSEFSSMLYSTTVLRPLTRAFAETERLGRERVRYEYVQWQFDTLKQVKEYRGPKFVFAHFLLPHTPYVFDRHGNFTSGIPLVGPEAKKAYIEQLIYTNKQIQELIDHLLDGPEQSHPVIVLQSDEGPHPDALQRNPNAYSWTRATDQELKAKFRLLNAYYLPGAGRDAPLYRSISPVNTFRVIFNEYFGTDLRLLSDRSYQYSDLHHLYKFFEVTDRVR